MKYLTPEECLQGHKLLDVSGTEQVQIVSRTPTVLPPINNNHHLTRGGRDIVSANLTNTNINRTLQVTFHV